MAFALAGDKPSTKGQAWFCSTGLPSDIVIQVEEMSFHLHKFPLMSKSRKLHKAITQQETQSSPMKKYQEIEEEEIEEEENTHCHITLQDFPGGSETFEMAVKFCYGVKIDFSATNVAPLRCAGEYLEMTEEYSEENLISKTESFMARSVFKSLKASVKALKSCERVNPLSEELEITQRCIDAIVSRASSTDPTLFGWPVVLVADTDEFHGHGVTATSNQALWNGIETSIRRRNQNNTESLFDNLSQLSLSLFNRLILAMRSRDLKSEIIQSCLVYYANKHVPGVARLNPKPSSSSLEKEQRELLESIIANFPLQKTFNSLTTPTPSTRFLSGLLRTANILNASEACCHAMEKKIGSQLEQATLDDIMIPSYSYLNETLYNVDCVERMLGYFLEDTAIADRSPSLKLVGKLIDGFLAEIASDANLNADRFYNLAISLPNEARHFDDGLYRAVDVYLKAHPLMTEVEREKICGTMDFKKLTLEACTHAAQNERLPLRAMVQVLFFEQLQLRHDIARTLMENNEEISAPGNSAAAVDDKRWRTTVSENQVLRLDMDSMRTRVHQLERECLKMKKVIANIDEETEGEDLVKVKPWSLTKKLGCKFKTQVCDSHEPTVIETKRGKHH